MVPPGSSSAITGAAVAEEALNVDADNLLAKAADNLSVRRAFGAAYEKDGMLIIPVAIVAGGGGGGTGHARRDNPATGPGSLPAPDATAPDATQQDSGRPEPACYRPDPLHRFSCCERQPRFWPDHPNPDNPCA